ncbi:MAG: hypothetical protein G01um101456_404, partial [Parcubacteria group bacterium Gr01-1014_56]
MYVYFSQNTPATEQISIDSLNNDPDYYYDEILRTDSKVFLCKNRRSTEAACVLVTYDGKATTDVGVTVDNPSVALRPSPDGQYILVTKEQEGFLLNAT